MSETEQHPTEVVPPPAPVDPAVLAAQKEAQAASSIGAQVILDFNEDASLGARGGAGADLVENQMARDTHLVAMGLDPVSPSGPPPTPEALRARREAEARASDPQFMPPASGKATRVSSLAAGISSSDVPPAEGGAPANVDVPFLSQAGSVLSVTMGNWTNEPSSYAYQWRIDGVHVGSDAATYDPQAADVGRSADCIVTASNAAGSTAAPPSNAVVVA